MTMTIPDELTSQMKARVAHELTSTGDVECRAGRIAFGNNKEVFSIATLQREMI